MSPSTRLHAFTKKHFYIGIVTFVPFVLASWSIWFVYDLLTSFIRSPIEYVVQTSSLPETIVGIAAILVMVLATFVLGILVELILERKIIQPVEKLVDKIPGVRSVYRFTKETLGQIFSPDGMPLGRVAGFRGDGYILIGFVTEISKYTANVMVFSTPSPSNGFPKGVEIENLYLLSAGAEQTLQRVIRFGGGLTELYDEFLVLEQQGKSYKTTHPNT